MALWRSFMSVVEALRPRAVLLKNVPDMARWNDGAILIAILDALREMGYLTDARVLKAWEFGVPQHRARLFVVGTLRQFEWPRRRPRVTLRDAIGDLPSIAPGHREVRLPYGPEVAPSRFQIGARRGLRAASSGFVDDHCCRDVRADDAEAFALLRPRTDVSGTAEATSAIPRRHLR